MGPTASQVNGVVSRILTDVVRRHRKIECNAAVVQAPLALLLSGDHQRLAGVQLGAVLVYSVAWIVGGPYGRCGDPNEIGGSLKTTADYVIGTIGAWSGSDAGPAG
jgi:hypothetical protein